jgi:myo-inositol-1(or 4)-monophosphatase
MNPARLEFTIDLVHDIGRLLNEGKGRIDHLRMKGSEVNLVTEFDERAEAVILERIQSQYPGEAILTEETGVHGTGGIRWVVDPLDGTTNFAHGIPFYCVSIAYLEGEEPVLGVVYAPNLGELFTVIRGSAPRLNQEPLAVSSTSTLGQALLVTGFPYDVRSRKDNNLDHYSNLALKTRAVRRMGSAALELCYVAAGRFDGYWELETNPWDLAAGALAVLEAGGRISTLAGEPPSYTRTSSMLASNGLLHPVLLSELNRPAAGTPG